LGEWEAARQCYFRHATEERLTPALALRLGRIESDRGEVTRALEQYGRADLSRGSSDDAALLKAWTTFALWSVGRAEEARVAAREALESAQIGNSGRAVASAHTAAMLAALGNDDAAFRHHYELGLRAATAAGDVLQIIRLRLNRQGPMRPREALSVIEPAVDLATLCGADLYLAAALMTRGENRVNAGLLDEGIADLEQARELTERYGSARWVRALGLLGHAYLTRGDLALARSAYERQLPGAERTNSVQDINCACAGLARVRAKEDPVKAAQLVDRAIAVRRSIGFGVSWSILTAGWLALGRGEPDRAVEYAHEGRQAADPD